MGDHDIYADGDRPPLFTVAIWRRREAGPIRPLRRSVPK
jgi:hypothetical protein